MSEQKMVIMDGNEAAPIPFLARMAIQQNILFSFSCKEGMARPRADIKLDEGLGLLSNKMLLTFEEVHSMTVVIYDCGRI